MCGGIDQNSIIAGTSQIPEVILAAAHTASCDGRVSRQTILRAWRFAQREGLSLADFREELEKRKIEITG